MALEIVWTKQAEKGYAKIIKYLDSHFGDKEIRNFIRQTHDFFDLLTEYPEMLKASKKHKYLHRGPINKNTILTYRIKPRKKQIQLINIRAARKKPLK